MAVVQRLCHDDKEVKDIRAEWGECAGAGPLMYRFSLQREKRAVMSHLWCHGA